MFRGAAAWAAVGLTYPAELAAMTRIPLWTFGMRITIGSVHEFIVSQVFALIAFPIVSKLTRGSKPSSEFLNEIFDVMKTK
jgi:hypothetical protein